VIPAALVGVFCISCKKAYYQRIYPEGQSRPNLSSKTLMGKVYRLGYSENPIVVKIRGY
jgi:hypothetical protein